jgi:hypothetical protein
MPALKRGIIAAMEVIVQCLGLVSMVICNRSWGRAFFWNMKDVFERDILFKNSPLSKRERQQFFEAFLSVLRVDSGLLFVAPQSS